ncbi:DUF4168 domain-containing protein [Arsenicitalea aurantiaca]|nr:DUF4168 domain-containing protein [Arsenicitalea aurantiaca]
MFQVAMRMRPPACRTNCIAAAGGLSSRHIAFTQWPSHGCKAPQLQSHEERTFAPLTGATLHAPVAIQRISKGRFLFNANLTRAALVAVGLAFVPAAAGTALAQGMVEQQAEPAPSYSDELIAAFATAFIEVNLIGEEVAPQMEQAETAEAQEDIMQQANSRMAEAVEATPGIDLQQYNEILTVAQADESLVLRINAEIESRAIGTPAQ